MIQFNRILSASHVVLTKRLHARNPRVPVLFRRMINASDIAGMSIEGNNALIELESDQTHFKTSWTRIAHAIAAAVAWEEDLLIVRVSAEETARLRDDGNIVWAHEALA
ncbi:MAG: hypothetical protein KGI79_01430 [Patescibacteria group bacterium]|nr:hypothetical protein [Patescibacteria group bacterium]MDE2116519.1 hypothetical protein [Patescibacteria group bacterium]